jgi:hypothetical protein
MRRRSRAAALVGVMALVGVSCGDGAASQPVSAVEIIGGTRPRPTTSLPHASIVVTVPPSTVPSSTVPSGSASVSSEVDSADSDSTAADSTASDDSATTTTAPDDEFSTSTAEPIEYDGLGPPPGSALAVVGAGFDDGLSLRDGPSSDDDVVSTLSSTADDVIATGRAEEVDGDLWLFVQADDKQGWVVADRVGFLGEVDDRTNWFVSFYAGPRREDTMEELGERLAGAHAASVQELSGNVLVPTLRQVTAATVGDLGEVTFDVIGSNDSAVLGVRLHVFGTPNADGTSFVLASVEETTICVDGLSESGACI